MKLSVGIAQSTAFAVLLHPCLEQLGYTVVAFLDLCVVALPILLSESPGELSLFPTSPVSHLRAL